MVSLILWSKQLVKQQLGVEYDVGKPRIGNSANDFIYIFNSRSRLLTVDGYRVSRLRCACVSDGEFSFRKHRSSGPSLLGGRLIMFGQRRICGGAGIDSKLVISSGLGHDVVCTQRLTIYRGISTSLWETPSERLMSMFHSGREHEVLTINRYVVLLDGP